MRNERGFTFYEVLIVLLVMGIVAAGSIWLTQFAPQSGNAEVSTTSNWGAIYVWSAQEQRQLAFVVPKLPGPVQIFRFERDARVGCYPQNSSTY